MYLLLFFGDPLAELGLFLGLHGYLLLLVGNPLADLLILVIEFNLVLLEQELRVVDLRLRLGGLSLLANDFLLQTRRLQLFSVDRFEDQVQILKGDGVRSVACLTFLI